MNRRISFLIISICLLFNALPLSAQMSAPRPTRGKVFAASVEAVKQSKILDSIAAAKLSLDEFPANELYNGEWSTDGVNKNRLPLDSVPDSTRFSLIGYVPPISGKITSVFGPRKRRYHYGLDIKINVGDSIHSAFQGMVRVTRYDRGGYGWYVVIRHSNGLETVYGHLSKIFVEEGQTLTAGQVFALGGNTGRSTGPHLHFETRFLGNPINPSHIIDFEGDSVKMKKFMLIKSKEFAYSKEARKIKAAKYHKVRTGDTLSRIAVKYGTSVSYICRLNGISRNKTLRIGQRIRYN